jgi:hypothetical protein
MGRLRAQEHARAHARDTGRPRVSSMWYYRVRAPGQYRCRCSGCTAGDLCNTACACPRSIFCFAWVLSAASYLRALAKYIYALCVVRCCDVVLCALRSLPEFKHPDSAFVTLIYPPGPPCSVYLSYTMLFSAHTAHRASPPFPCTPCSLVW